MQDEKVAVKSTHVLLMMVMMVIMTTNSSMKGYSRGPTHLILMRIRCNALSTFNILTF